MPPDEINPPPITSFFSLTSALLNTSTSNKDLAVETQKMGRRNNQHKALMRQKLIYYNRKSWLQKCCCCNVSRMKHLQQEK
jgi:hypothetical protein